MVSFLQSFGLRHLCCPISPYWAIQYHEKCGFRAFSHSRGNSNLECQAGTFCKSRLLQQKGSQVLVCQTTEACRLLQISQSERRRGKCVWLVGRIESKLSQQRLAVVASPREGVPTFSVSSFSRAEGAELAWLSWLATQHLTLHTSDGGADRFMFLWGPLPLGPPVFLGGRVGLTSPGSNTSSGRLRLVTR
jgi:hypothetical protein